MAKTIERNTNNFVDRTHDSWYSKKDSKQIVFCKSVDDLIDGNAEKHEFVSREMSVRYDKNSKNEDVERNQFILFTLDNGNKVLVRMRDELR
jgi:hypothetical protein